MFASDRRQHPASGRSEPFSRRLRASSAASVLLWCLRGWRLFTLIVGTARPPSPARQAHHEGCPGAHSELAGEWIALGTGNAFPIYPRARASPDTRSHGRLTGRGLARFDPASADSCRRGRPPVSVSFPARRAPKTALSTARPSERPREREATGDH